MAVTIDEIENFMDVFHEQNIQKVKESDLRKAIRHYWNVASQPTVDDRIETLEQEDWIEQIPHSDSWKIIQEKNDSIEKLFRERGKEQ